MSIWAALPEQQQHCWWPCCHQNILLICHGKLQTTHSTGMVTRLSPSDGSVIWTASLGTGVSSVDRRAITAAISPDGTIYVVSDLGAYNSLQGQGRATSPGINSTTTCPVCSLTAISKTGSILWQADLPNRRMNAGAAAESSALSSNRHQPSILIDDDGYLWVAGTMDENGDYIWQCDPADGSVSAAYGRSGSFSFPYSWPASTGSDRIEVAVSGANCSHARIRRGTDNKITAKYEGTGTNGTKIFRFDTSGNVEYSTRWDTDQAISGKSGSSPLPQYLDAATNDIYVDGSEHVYAANPGREDHSIIVANADWVADGRPIYDEWHNNNWASTSDRTLLDTSNAGTPAEYGQFLRKYGPKSGGSGYELDKLYQLEWRTSVPRWRTYTLGKVTSATSPHKLQWGYGLSSSTGSVPYTTDTGISVIENGGYVIRGCFNTIWTFEDYQFTSNEWRPTNTANLVTTWNVFGADGSNGGAVWSHLFGRDNVTTGLNQQDRRIGSVAAMVNYGTDVILIGASTTGSGGTNTGFPLIERVSGGSGSRAWQVGISSAGNTNATDCIAFGGAYRNA